MHPIRTKTPFLLAALTACLIALPLAGCGGDGNGTAVSTPALPPQTSASVQLGGIVNQPGAYTLADLNALPAVTQTDTYTSASGVQTHAYTGTLLWSLLDSAGIQTNPAVHNDVLNDYVVATGSDGYRALFSLGELNPNFGNRPDLVAYAIPQGSASGPIPAADGGPLRVTAPADGGGGRYVSQLVRLDVRQSAATATGTGGGVSPSFVVSGQVSAPATFDLDALKALPAVTQTVGANVYTGVSLWTLLNSVGLTVSTAKNPTLTMYAVATGSDGYRALVSLGEINPGFGNDGALVAYAENGAPLDTTGMARLVIPGEVMQGRLVSNLVAIEVLADSGS